MNISSFALKKPAVIILVFLGLTVWGVYTYKKISRREDPEIKISMSVVFTVYPGASAAEVEKKITKPIEEALETVSSVKEISSSSRNNVSIIFLKVDYNSDFNQQWDLVRARIASLKDKLPSTITGPRVIDDFADVSGMIYTIHGKNTDPDTLEDLAEKFKDKLKQIKSVGKIEISGKPEKVIEISGTLDDFLRYDFSPLKASRLLSAQNTGMPGGILHTRQTDYRLIPPNEYNSLDEIKNQIFDASQTTGEPLKIGQIFKVKEKYADPQNVIVRTNGEPSLMLNIVMRSGYDITKMGKEIRKLAAEFRKTLPEGVTLTNVHDQPRHVDENLGAFIENLIQSLILVAIAMALLLGIGSSLLVSMGLPLAVFIAIAFMPLFNVDLERASVASFIIALGILVDNSIIVIDQIHNLLDEGEDLKTACIRGAHDLVLPIFSGTIASVLAFFPLILLPDEIGAYIRALPVVLTLSLGASFFISITITPLFAYYYFSFKNKIKSFLGKKKESDSVNEKTSENKSENIKQTKKDGIFKRAYRTLMSGSLKLWPLVFILAGLSFVGAIYMFKQVGVSFFPKADRDQFVVDIWTPEGSSIYNTDKITKRVEKLIAENPDTVSYTTSVGKGLPRFWIALKPEFNSFNFAQIIVNTKSPEATLRAVRKLEDQTKDIAGARIIVKQLLMGIAIDSPIAIKIYGDDISKLRQLSEKMQEILLKTPGVKNTRDDFGSNSLAYDISIDEEKAERLGITRAEIAMSLISAANGFPVTTWRKEDDPVPVVLKITDGEVKKPEDLMKLSVRSQITGEAVRLASFMNIKPKWEVGKIQRKNWKRAITVMGYTKNGVLADTVLNAALPEIRKIEMPDGYHFEIEGEQKERTKTFGDLTKIFIIIIFSLFFVLVFQFGTFLQALVILGSIPLALVGAVLGLYVTGNSFGFSSFLGIIALAGIVIKNAVVWVDFVETALHKGVSYREAVIRAGLARLRPILLTAATTIGGLVPLALKGGALWGPMGWTMIFGLTVATVLTLVVIPVFYYVLVKHKEVKVQQ